MIETEAELFKVLVRDNTRMRAVGCELAEAATRVIRTWDGTHRLGLAVAKWMEVIADEGGRGALADRLEAALSETVAT